MHSKYGKYHAYYSPEQLSTEGTTLIENYFSASPYPSTIGYKKECAKIEPTFPDNSNYKENDITRNNITVVQWMCNEIAKYPVSLNEYFWQWGKKAVEEMLKLNKEIDFSPLQKATEFDNTAFVRKLTVKELFNIICLGGRATAFDRGSLRITCGKRLFPCIDKAARYTGNIRRRLYLKLRK